MGSGSSSKKKTLVIEKSTRNFNRHVANMPFLRTDAQRQNCTPIITKQLITLVWLDSRSASQDDIIDTQNTKRSLSTAVRNATLTCFSDTKLCVEFLRQHQDTVEIIFLIISGYDSIFLFNSMDNALFRCIDSIFIFCLAKNRYDNQLLYERKVVGIFNEHLGLVQCIQKQAIRLAQQDLIISYYSQTQKTVRIVPAHAKGEFVWIRALKEAILKMEKDATIRRSMYDRCRILYRHDARELEKIKEFESKYRAEDAIIWYTKDSFLYRIVNQSLRTENTNELLLFSPFIADLCQAVRALQTKINKKSTVFRGCVFNKTALDELNSNIGSLLSINTFFSASHNRDVAIMFAACHCLDGNTTDVSVLFEIEVNEGTQSFFTNISFCSTKKEEEEVLFDLNAVFTIRDVIYSDSDECWVVHLIADEETYLKNERIYQEVCHVLGLDGCPIITVGVSLMIMGNTRDAFRYAIGLPLPYQRGPAFELFFITTCLVECNYAAALKQLTSLYKSFENSNSFEIHENWTTVALFIVNVLIIFGESQLAVPYLESIVKYYETVAQESRYIYKAPYELLRFLDNLRAALVDDDEIWTSQLLIKHLSIKEIPVTIQALMLPGTRMRLARALTDLKYFDEALDHLEQAEIEGSLLLSDRALIRHDIHLTYACIYLQEETFDECRLHLNEAERIARLNLSSSCPSNLGCIYLLRQTMTILETNTGSETYLSSARSAFLRTKGYIHVPNVVFILTNLCKIYEEEKHSSHSSASANLRKLLTDAFQLCRFEKIMEGKSPENKYRPLLEYYRKLPVPEARSTQTERL